MLNRLPNLDPHDQRIVLMGLVCYLLNLLLLPAVPVCVIAWLYFSQPVTHVGKAYLRQLLYWSLIGGVLLVGTCGLVWWQISLGQPTAWVWLIIYLLCVHTTLVLLGMLSLARALACKPCLPVWPAAATHSRKTIR